jgi:hypothetical protein
LLSTLIMQLKFVSIDQPGKSAKPGDAFELRSHVRKVILERKAARGPRLDVRFTPGVTCHDGALSSRKKPQSRLTSIDRLKSRRGPARRRLEAGAKLDCPGRDLPQQIWLPLCKGQPTLLHPFASMAALYVKLPVQRLDELFKSEAFRHAAEPLFDTTYIDSPLNLQHVFPTCFADTVFLQALVYSIMLAHNRGHSTVEQLRLKSQALLSLKSALASIEESGGSCTAALSAMIVLRGSAYKWEDAATHSVHALGVAALLNNPRVTVTPEIRHALFWQDLFASVLVSTPRQFSTADLPPSARWLPSNTATKPAIPAGFLRHAGFLPPTLLEAARDLLTLQAEVARNKNQWQLEPIQATIESLLASSLGECKQHGIPALATRLALFIIAYMSYMETWDFSLIPGKLAQQLIALIEPGMACAGDVFGYHDHIAALWSMDGEAGDLLLWLLLVGSQAARADGGVVEGLQERYVTALQQCQHTALLGWSFDNMPARNLARALEDFIYLPGMVDNRLTLPEWATLEAECQSPCA